MFGKQAKVFLPKHFKKLLAVAGKGRFPERDDLEAPLCSPANIPAKPALIFCRIDPAPTPCRSRVLTIMLASEW